MCKYINMCKIMSLHKNKKANSSLLCARISSRYTDGISVWLRLTRTDRIGNEKLGFPGSRADHEVSSSWKSWNGNGQIVCQAVVMQMIIHSYQVDPVSDFSQEHQDLASYAEWSSNVIARPSETKDVTPHSFSQPLFLFADPESRLSNFITPWNF